MLIEIEIKGVCYEVPDEGAENLNVILDWFDWPWILERVICVNLFMMG
jgi:hypothetical protein